MVDDLLRHPTDVPTVGLILCKQKNQIVAEYVLRSMAAPVGISGYQLTETLPDGLKGSLPSVEQIERELSIIEGDPG